MIVLISLFLCAICFFVFAVLHVSRRTEKVDGLSTYEIGMIVSFVLMTIAFIYVMYTWWTTHNLYELLKQNDEEFLGDIHNIHNIHNTHNTHNISLIPAPSTGKKSHLEQAIAMKDPQERLNMVQLLLERSADPNIPMLNGMSLLHQAVILKDVQLVKLLLENGADPNAKSLDGKTPLFMLHDDHKQNGEKIIELLIEHGADVEAKNNELNTPLLYFLYRGPGYLKPATQLMKVAKQSINPNSVNAEGNNALYYAVDFVINEPTFFANRLYTDLMEMPIDVNHVNKVGETILHKLARSFRLDSIQDVVQELKQKGALTNIPNQEGNTFDEITKRRT